MPRKGSFVALFAMLVATALAGAVYGYFLHRNQLFPYSLGRSLLSRHLRAAAAGDGLPGFWVPAPADTATGDSSADLQRLKTLGYLSGYREGPAGKGVTVYQPGRVGCGLSLYSSAHAPRAFLIDTEGNVLHSWQRSYSQVFPDSPADTRSEGHNYWRTVHLYPSGDLLVIFNTYGVARLDRDSNVRWARFNHAHHTLDVAPDGRIFVLTFDAYIADDVQNGRAVREDYIEVLDPDGRFVERFSVLAAIRESPYSALLDFAATHGDVLHINAIQILDSTYEEEFPAFKKGALLVSSRELNTVAVIDPEEKRVVWALPARTQRQHDPTLVSQGNILIFDNRSQGQGSQAVEIDPATQRSVWEYPREPDDEFFSLCCGMAQRLANGNTLITVTGMGRAVEVSRAGEVVWQFDSPHRAGPQRELVAALMMMRRIPFSLVADWLEPVGSTGSSQASPCEDAPAR